MRYLCANRMEGQVGRLEELGSRIVDLVHTAVALKEDLEIELAHGFIKGHENPGSPQEVPALVSTEAAQPSQPSLALQPQPQTPSPSRATSVMHPSDNSRELYMPILDAILKNQEALQMILANQETLKTLVDRLLKTVSNLEERVHTIEQEMSILAQFTQEIQQVENETTWG